MFRRTI